MLYFITSNNNKFEEARAILQMEMEQLDIDLPELQDIDAHNVIKAKLNEAMRHHEGEFIVDDVSLVFDALKGELPGPFIKWFLQSLGAEGIYDFVSKLGDTRATAKLIVGYADGKDNIHFFEGAVEGNIVKPAGERFGWDPIFLPKGYNKTYAQMPQDEKNKMSHRHLALTKLKEFLQTK